MPICDTGLAPLRPIKLWLSRGQRAEYESESESGPQKTSPSPSC